ncbi:hypothetical protein BLNAU_9917 [Blattamonas nauphoetae]|uniref:Uncharacterized protein n=1 Tax=Blattamonas nauphoetae TaxID=2049346 RepID=A0ABQ9XUN1_9EUKA|nr:hypothetical protein BLNAU_9917 [Blattamonas nauphoetae]
MPSPSSFLFSIPAPSPPTSSHSPLPLPRHPHPPTPLCLSHSTHTLPLPSASPSPPTPSHSPLPLPLHPHPPTPLCLSLTTHTLPLPSASPSPPTPSHSPLPLPHHPHPPTPLTTLDRKTKLSIAIPAISLLANPTSTALEGWTRLALIDLVGSSTSEHNDIKTDRLNDRTPTQPTSRLATSSPQSPRFRLDTHHIVAFALSMCRCYVVTPRTAGDTGVPVDSARVEPDIAEVVQSDERRRGRDEGGVGSVVFMSLVATVKIQPALDDSLEAKAITFLESWNPDDKESSDVFLNSIRRTTDESLTNFVQSIGVLISSANKTITTAIMSMLRTDLIPQLINTLNILSPSFAEAEEIHTHLLKILHFSLWLPTPYGFAELEIDNQDDRQAARETVLTQILTPSEMYICHLCANRFSIIDGKQSRSFLRVLAQLVRIYPVYQPTMDLSPSIITTLTFSFADTLALLPLLLFEGRRMDDDDWWEFGSLGLFSKMLFSVDITPGL